MTRLDYTVQITPRSGELVPIYYLDSSANTLDMLDEPVRDQLLVQY